MEQFFNYVTDTLVVVTQVFPDEFHLHTLDQFLSATSRLNPHVNIKAIVVGLMDRLSAYAQRESETESPDDRKKMEEESISKLMEQLKIAKEKKEEAPQPSQENGEASTDTPAETEVDEASVSGTTAVPPSESETTETEDEVEVEVEKRRGIPSNIKLFEIFHEQVAALVKMQRLTIQDTIGLLVSLANLAL